MEEGDAQKRNAATYQTTVVTAPVSKAAEEKQSTAARTHYAMRIEATVRKLRAVAKMWDGEQRRKTWMNCRSRIAALMEKECTTVRLGHTEPDAEGIDATQRQPGLAAQPYRPAGRVLDKACQRMTKHGEACRRGGPSKEKQARMVGVHCLPHFLHQTTASSSRRGPICRRAIHGVR